MTSCPRAGDLCDTSVESAALACIDQFVELGATSVEQEPKLVQSALLALVVGGESAELFVRVLLFRERCAIRLEKAIRSGEHEATRGALCLGQRGQLLVQLVANLVRVRDPLEVPYE